MIFQNRRDQALRKAGDDDSEMSAESATSDSGRGGSEEDINSNRGNPMSDTGMRLIQFKYISFSSDIHRAHRYFACTFTKWILISQDIWTRRMGMENEIIM